MLRHDYRAGETRVGKCLELVYEGGKIIEDGTYDELIEQNGFFAELVERQRLDRDSEKEAEPEAEPEVNPEAEPAAA